MILVTLGTHPQPMDRLVAEMDRLLEIGAINEEVIIQAAAAGTPARHINVLAVIPYDELRRLVQAARVVVSHAGPGNLALIGAAGKVAVVVPRDERMGEHVDDHQRRYAARLNNQPGYIVVDHMDQLNEAINSAASLSAGQPREMPPESIAMIRSLIEGCTS